MLRADACAVKPPPDAPAQTTGGFTAPDRLPQTAGMDIALPLLVLLLAGAAFWLALRLRRGSLQRQQAISQLLDAADALEARLRAARAEIETVAGHDGNPVRAAMQDLLRQRLWLQENAERASLAQLRGVRDALDAARASLDRQLRRVDQARAGAA